MLQIKMHLVNLYYAMDNLKDEIYALFSLLDPTTPKTYDVSHIIKSIEKELNETNGST